MDEDSILERERYQIEQIRELDDEELQIEEVEGLPEDSDDDHAMSHIRIGARIIAWFEKTKVTDAESLSEGPVLPYIVPFLLFLFPWGRCGVLALLREKELKNYQSVALTKSDSWLGEFTFDTCLASLHTYLGEVEDTHHRTAFVDTGAILTLPLFYLEGVVLFPEATLPLRIIQPNFIVAVERAMGQIDSPYTIGVVRVYRDLDFGRLRFSAVGTTAEIRQYRRLEDGSVNVVTHGKQRFHVRRHWIDTDGAPCGEIEVIEEDLPLRTPRDAIGTLPPLSNLSSRSFSDATKSHHQAKRHRDAVESNCSDAESEESFLNELSISEMRLHQSAVESCCAYDTIDESTSSDDEKYVCESELRSGQSKSSDGSSQSKCRRRIDAASGVANKDKINQSPQKGDAWGKRDMWKQVVGAPSMDGFVRKPDILSFYIASKIPISESTRQELLEINGVSYRLRREIELLEGFDRVRCKNCQTVIARRSDMLVMSNEGPLGAYVNPNGFVHEIMTLYKANGLALIGRPREEYSWFPGYKWTIANCATCESHMGWLFTAANKKLKPKTFWGVRSSQVADDMR
uniref:Protein cereblon n=1 Tax=Chenopodium quinoa TaxID=63459 RepID=A0A803N855_CHEQI